MSSQHSERVVAEGERIYTVGGVVRGGLWLYATSLLNNACGFLYWLVISAIAGPEVVGVVSAIVGLYSIIMVLLSLGTIISIRRFYGIAIGKGDKNTLSIYFWTHLAYLVVVYGTASLTIFLLACMGISISGLKGMMLAFLSICLVMSVAEASQSLVISMLRTEIMFAASLIGNVLKFIIGLYLVSRGYGWLGAAIGYICPLLTTYITSLAYALKRVSLKPVISTRALFDIVSAGIVYWIPNALNIIGMHFGILLVLGMSGATETGVYYIALVIANLVLMLSTSMLSLLLPALSGLENDREELARRILRVSSSIIFPLATYFIFYSWLPLSLLGRTYIKASPILSILLLGALP